MERRYCGQHRVCSHTGFESTCGAPLHFQVEEDTSGIVVGDLLDEEEPAGYWYCQVCGLFGAKNAKVREWWPHNNDWEFHRVEEDLGAREREAYLSDWERAQLEWSRRPRAVLEDIEPSWRCANREALEEAGVKIDASLEFNRDVPSIGQIDLDFAHRLLGTEVLAHRQAHEWETVKRNLYSRRPRYAGGYEENFDHSWVSDVGTQWYLGVVRPLRDVGWTTRLIQGTTNAYEAVPLGGTNGSNNGG